MSNVNYLFAVEAEQLLGAEMYAEALQLCKDGVAAFPEYAAGYAVLMEIYIKVNDMESAKTLCQTAISNFPANKKINLLKNEIDNLKESEPLNINLDNKDFTHVFNDGSQSLEIIEETTVSSTVAESSEEERPLSDLYYFPNTNSQILTDEIYSYKEGNEAEIEDKNVSIDDNVSETDVLDTEELSVDNTTETGSAIDEYIIDEVENNEIEEIIEEENTLKQVLVQKQQGDEIDELENNIDELDALQMNDLLEVASFQIDKTRFNAVLSAVLEEENNEISQFELEPAVQQVLNTDELISEPDSFVELNEFKDEIIEEIFLDENDNSVELLSTYEIEPETDENIKIEETEAEPDSFVELNEFKKEVIEDEIIEEIFLDEHDNSGELLSTYELEPETDENIKIEETETEAEPDSFVELNEFKEAAIEDEIIEEIVSENLESTDELLGNYEIEPETDENIKIEETDAEPDSFVELNEFKEEVIEDEIIEEIVSEDLESPEELLAPYELEPELTQEIVAISEDNVIDEENIEALSIGSEFMDEFIEVEAVEPVIIKEEPKRWTIDKKSEDTVSDSLNIKGFLKYFIDRSSELDIHNNLKASNLALIPGLTMFQEIPVQDVENIPQDLEESGEEAAQFDENDSIFITDTIADIYEKQGAFKESIEAYQKLLERYPEKEDFYKEKIEKLEKLIN